MKPIILSLVLLTSFPFLINSQETNVKQPRKAIGYFSPAYGFQNVRGKNISYLNASIGGYAKNKKRAAMGLSFDFFVFNKNLKFVVPKLDFRMIFSKTIPQNGGPFLSFQPGTIILTKNNPGYIKTKTLVLEALGGYFGKWKNGVGTTVSIGYSSYIPGFSRNNSFGGSGIKFQFGFHF